MLGTFVHRPCRLPQDSQQQIGTTASRKVPRKVTVATTNTCRGDKGRLLARSFGKDVVEGWLDVAKLVSASGSDSKSAFSELAENLGRDIYVDVNGWHLYLRDITAAPGLKMNHALANQLGSQLLIENLGDEDIEGLLRQVPLVLGGGKLKVRLSDALPQYCMDDFLKICRDFAENA